jgi:hypothetical protein
VPVKWKILPGWYVLVTFPNGKELPINVVFRTKAEALESGSKSTASRKRRH